MFQIKNIFFKPFLSNRGLEAKQFAQCASLHSLTLSLNRNLTHGASGHCKRSLSDSASNQKLSGIIYGFLYFFIRSTLKPRAIDPALEPAKTNLSAFSNLSSNYAKISSTIKRP